MLNPIQPNPAGNAALHRVVEIYHHSFGDRPEARTFLAGVGLADTRFAEKFQLGFADGALSRILPRQGPVRDSLVTLGIIDAAGGERFAGQIVVPVWDAGDRLVNLWGLSLDLGAVPVGLHHRPLGVWNLGAVKTHSRVVLTDSAFDAWAAIAAGHDNVIAVPEAIPDELAEALRTHSVLQVTILGGDEPRGRERAEAIKAQAPGVDLRWRQLAQPLHALLRTQGAEALKEWLAADPERNAKPGIPVDSIPGGFSVRFGTRHYEVRGLEKGPRHLKATVHVEHAGREHVDTLDLYAARCRRQFSQDLARVFEESALPIETEVTRLVAVCDAHAGNPAASTEPVSAVEVTSDAREQAEGFGRRPDLVQAILQDFDRCGLVGERANKLLCYLAITSRKLDRPLAVLIQSSSGAGKTALQDAALGFCPPEDRRRRSP